jgi:hypothetical protein
MNTTLHYEKLIKEFESKLERELQEQEMDFLNWIHIKHTRGSFGNVSVKERANSCS